MGQTRIVHAVGEVAVGADGVPTEFRLLKAGVNTYANGSDQILFDDEAAVETMKRYRARGIDLMADYEHQSLVRPPVQAPASAKKWVPEVRGGDLMATSIAWTEKAKSMLAAGEYRYFSIACKVEAKSGRCIELINFALTNTPAADGIAPLVAASRNLQTENDMKTVIVALGLSAEADESAAVTKASRLVELERDVLALTKAKTLSEAVGILGAHAASHEQVVALTAQVKALEADKRGAEFDKLVAKGQDGKQITKAMAEGAWLKSLRTREDGIEQLTAFLASAPAHSSVEPIVESNAPVVSSSPDLTPEEIAVAKRFVGGDPVALEKRLEQLKQMKAQDKRSAA